MNELDVLYDLGTALDPATPDHAPARLRHRVLHAAGPTTHRPWKRRLVLAGALAAVVTAALLVTQALAPNGNASATAAEVLHGAAAEARAQTALTPRDDQFVYIESRTKAAALMPGVRATFPEEQRTVWLSADGSRPGLLRTESGDLPLPNERGYRADLPTDTEVMRKYLYDHASGGNPRDQQAFTTAADLIREAYLSPAALAAVFDAVARIPGVDVVGDVTDDAGRPGVAVALTEVQGMRTELIFDKATHAFLGVRSVMVRDDPTSGLVRGDIFSSASVLRTAIVDRAGQTP
ncbi:CU044_5270 family protein [Dactylosporangium sp. CS-047395]|uniref:CU044_5270 family protein n=1 Tax=Dactylosporangium sp. CS-047395 TaxID=3239936 RepID=UPI003D92AA81